MAVNAEGHFGGLLVVWNDAMFAMEEVCMGHFSAVVN